MLSPSFSLGTWSASAQPPPMNARVVWIPGTQIQSSVMVTSEPASLNIRFLNVQRAPRGLHSSMFKEYPEAYIPGRACATGHFSHTDTSGPSTGTGLPLSQGWHTLRSLQPLSEVAPCSLASAPSAHVHLFLELFPFPIC